jgi:hypothetical protein
MPFSLHNVTIPSNGVGIASVYCTNSTNPGLTWTAGSGVAVTRSPVMEASGNNSAGGAYSSVAGTLEPTFAAGGAWSYYAPTGALVSWGP